MIEDMSDTRADKRGKPCRNWPHAIWQSGAVFLLAAAVGLLFNQFRPDGLPLVANWSMEAQLASAKPDENLTVSLEEAKALFVTQAALFLDSRSEEFYRLGHIAGARNLPWEDFENRFQDVMGDVPLETLIITYCDGESCSLSKDLALALLGKGYTEVRVLLNGWSLWKESHLPTGEE